MFESKLSKVPLLRKHSVRFLKQERKTEINRPEAGVAEMSYSKHDLGCIDLGLRS